MNEAVLADPVLARFKTELQALYGTRLKRVLLYGSRARGDHQPDSDYDVLVVLEGPIDYWPELNRLAELSSDILWDTVAGGDPVVASFKAVAEEDIQRRTGFMHNVRREMIEI
jgi:uncharacterized protein